METTNQDQKWKLVLLGVATVVGIVAGFFIHMGLTQAWTTTIQNWSMNIESASSTLATASMICMFGPVGAVIAFILLRKRP